MTKRLLTIMAALTLLPTGVALGQIDIATPTYTGHLVAAGADFIVLDTDFNGRRLLKVDPNTVFTEAVYPSMRLRVEFRMRTDNLPHARLVAPAPEPALIPVPLDRAAGNSYRPELARATTAPGAHAAVSVGSPWALMAPLLALLLPGFLRRDR